MISGKIKKITRSAEFKAGALRMKVNKNLAALGFLIIPLLFYIVFVIAPVFQGAYFSFFKWNGLVPLTHADNVGLKNYIDILNDGIFRKAVTNNLLIIILSLIFQLPTALIIALAIGRRFKGSVIFRSIFFLPYILAEIITGAIFYFIYNPNYGLPNSIFAQIIPPLASTAFLSDPKTVFYAIFVALWWKYFGLHMIIYIAGLQGIPDELEEAAYVDGATSWQINWHIILPLLRPTIVVSIFFCIVGSFQVFDIVWAMGRGGPVHAAETMVTYLINYGFAGFHMGYGSAVAVVIFLICLVFSIVYQRILMRQEK